MPAKGSKKGSKKGSNKGGKKGSRKGVATRSSSRLAEKRKEEENTPEVKDEPAAMDVSETETETKTATTVIKEGEKVIDTRKIALDELRSNVHLLAQAVGTKDNLLFLRVVRHINSVRKKMTPGNLSLSVKKYCEDLDIYLKGFESTIKAEDVEEANVQVKLAAQQEEQEKLAAEKKAKEAAAKEEAELAARKGKPPTPEQKKEKEAELKKQKVEDEKKEKEAAREADKKAMREKQLDDKDAHARTLPEVKVYMHLLCVVFLVNHKKTDEAAACAVDLVTLLQSHNRRTLDQLSAKVWHYYSLTQEAIGQLGSIRNNLLLAHRTACLQHNEPGQAALVVAILRNFLHFKLYNQADNFRLNTNFPESRSNNNFSRYLYYVGQINSVQLHYSDAYANLTQAIRKAPQTTALSFRIKATKLMVIVQLLMGEIPERSLFRQADLKNALHPYFELTQAVRVGNPVEFHKISAQYKSVWTADHLSSLIDRLRNNVIKTGLRKINISYSRISIVDICEKLNFASPEDAEQVVAKAVHDGVIDAVIDREKGFLFSKENVDVYQTNEPTGAFHKRIQFCNDIHNGAVKALRYPVNAHKADRENENDDIIDNEKAIDEALAEAEKEDDDEM